MKIRASYSFLKTWSEGRIDEALRGYFHLTPKAIDPKYDDGIKFDRYAQEYIEKRAALPPEWGGDILDEYHVQYRLKTPYNSICELTGIMDVYENQGIVTELKSGKSSSGDYARTMQVPMYLYMCHKSKLKAEIGRIIRYNQHTKEHDRAILYPSKKMFDKVENFIESITPEIHEYFVEHDLFAPEEIIQQRLTTRIP